MVDRGTSGSTGLPFVRPGVSFLGGRDDDRSEPRSPECLLVQTRTRKEDGFTQREGKGKVGPGVDPDVELTALFFPNEVVA